MNAYYIGLMSGTSLDGIDAALLNFSHTKPQLIETFYLPFSNDLREKILALCTAGDNEIERLGELDILLAQQFAFAVNALLQRAKLSAENIVAIGSHGQTIRHIPNQKFTLQIGDPNTIAALTGITTIADFRRKDIAHGGQGAPLVPAFHRYLITDESKNYVVLNIGGIANVSILFKENMKEMIGFDTGPGNILTDAWIFEQQQKNFDTDGAWAKTGSISQTLLAEFLSDNYFTLTAPKSTGREYFNLAWIKNKIGKLDIDARDVQTTLTELTALTILQSLQHFVATAEIIVCGGGAHNQYLMSRLKFHAGNLFTIDTSDKFGIAPDWIEATAFAWLAFQTMNRRPGNMPSVTGAKKASVLGGIYYA